jgi:ADP-heptose:LPS heptosyltransferase
VLHPVATRTHAALGDLPRAEQHAGEAQRVAAYWESETWRAMADAAHATVLQARGNNAEALRRFIAAAEAFERIGQRFDAARCLLWAGSVPRASTGTVDQRGLVERALRSFQKLGAATAEAQARRQLALL